MRLLNRTAKMNLRWWTKAFLCASMSGFLAGLAFTYVRSFAPGCIKGDYITALISAPILGIPSLVGAIFGRYWLANGLLWCAIYASTMPSALRGDTSAQHDMLMGLGLFTLLAAGMSAASHVASLQRDREPQIPNPPVLVPAER